ncbi:MAG TPA: trypsin-like peptidase domain-containing protein, partial [Gemmataceae bacterium]
RQLVLTNYHVAGDVDRAVVMFPAYRGGELIAERDYYKQHVRDQGIRGRVVARDRQADLALIQIDRVPDGAQALPLAAEGVSPGQTVHSLGNPGGSGALWVYTPGKVRQVYHKTWAAKAGKETLQFSARVIETDSPTNPGDSGGPLVNDRAELVGVTQGGSTNASLLSVFVDVSEVKRFLATQAVRSIPAPGGAAAREPFTVKDGAKFFGPEAVQAANRDIAQIAHRYGRDLLIETYPTVPAEDAERVKGMSPDDRRVYFRDWARKRARAEGVNGVVILATRTPGTLYVLVTEGARGVVTRQEEERVHEALLAKFREKQYDAGLAEAVRLVREAFAEQRP